MPTMTPSRDGWTGVAPRAASAAASAPAATSSSKLRLSTRAFRSFRRYATPDRSLTAPTTLAPAAAAEALRGELAGQGVREAFGAGVRGDVVGVSAPGLGRGGGRDVDEDAVPPLHHVLPGRARDPERRLEVQVQDRLDILVRESEEQA